MTDTPKLLLAIDIGSSGVRAALYNDRGDLLPRTLVKQERSFTAIEDGGSELDADEEFGRVVEVIDAVLARAAALKGEITNVATSCFWHSLLGTDAKGRPSTRVFGWADTRGRKHVESLRKRFDETAVHDRTGARFHAGYWPAKLLRLKNDAPSVYSRTARWLSFSDHVASKLFGEYRTSVSMASATGIFDIRKLSWDVTLLRYLGLSQAQLPPLAASDGETFTLIRKYRTRWPRLAGAKWSLAVGDGAANNIGSGCVKPGHAALMIGTSGAMRVVYKGEPPRAIPPGLWCYRIDRRRVIIGGAISDGGGLYQWMTENLRFGDGRSIEKEIANRRPDGHGLTFLPFLSGERSTGYHGSATGGVLGLKSSTDAIDIVQAALESVAYRFAEVFEQLNSLVKIRRVTASGGALQRSRVWTQILADVLGHDITLANPTEASLRGAVLLTLESVGKIDNIEDLGSTPGSLFAPDKLASKSYASARNRHRALYEKLVKNTDI